MSHLPVSSRLKPPASRLAKAPSSKSEGIALPRSGLKPPSVETPQKSQSGLRQPLTKRAGSGDTEKLEKRSSNLTPVSGSGLVTPRTKQTGSQTKLGKGGLQPPQQTTVTKREGLTTNLKRQSSGSSSSLNREPEPPAFTRERTQESLKDDERGILFKIGDRVLVAGTKTGVIEYLGETKFAKGFWAGVKLDEPTGKNNGCVAGVRYFDCEPLHGVFSKPNRLHKINIVPEKKNSISDTHRLEESNVLKIGDSVIVSGTKIGILRYLGPTEFAKGEWAGVELKEPLGKNDGAVAGTRYFTCQMNYGLFAPAAKVTKSKRQVLHQKPQPVLSPESSFANVAKSVFNKTAPVSSEISDIPASPSEKQTTSENNKSASPIESLHPPLKKTPSASHQVAALQSALEEREREIRKMLMERELEKAEKLKASEETARSDDSALHGQALTEKDDMIKSLKHDLEKLISENSMIQSKLDEEKKKYEDLQFMLEEEKITDDELKNHVIEDESKIKELSDQAREKNKQIMELQKELREAHASERSHEAKILELREELTVSKSKMTHIKNNLETATGAADENTQRLEILLDNANKELDENREEVRRKTARINELESKLNERMNDQKEAEDRTAKKLKEKLMATEATSLSLNAKILDQEDQLTQAKNKISDLENDMTAAAVVAEQKTQHLEILLANTERERDERQEEANRKSQLLNEMENKLKAQLTRQKEIEKEVESLDQADKNLTLLKEAHRSEVEALQSEINTMAGTISSMEKKQEDLIASHRKEMEVLEWSKSAEIKRMNEKVSLIETEKNSALNECETNKLEKAKVLEELSRLQNDHSDILVSKDVTSEKLRELQKKCDELSEDNNRLSSELNDAIQLCEDQDEQLGLLKKEKDDIELERDLLSKDKDELSKKILSLETEIKSLHCESTTKHGELHEAKESEIRNLKAKLEEVTKEKQTTHHSISSLKVETNSLEKDIQAKENEINMLKSQQKMLHSLSQELEGQVSDLKRKMMQENERAIQNVKSLENEITVLKDDVEEGKSLLKQKDDDIRTYKEQIEKMGSEGFPKSPMDGDILENASTLLIRLNEAESKLAVLQSDKETADEQLEFLNSVIVDLQNKNEKANQHIALLEAGDESLILHGLDSESEDELVGKPKFSIRKFCDICDVFDQHDTDECPKQEGDLDDSGVKHHGDRVQERPYCGICEAFGHWSEDCDDEQTF